MWLANVFFFFICVFLYVFSAGEDTFLMFLLYISIIKKLLILFISLKVKGTQKGSMLWLRKHFKYIRINSSWLVNIINFWNKITFKDNKIKFF